MHADSVSRPASSTISSANAADGGCEDKQDDQTSREEEIQLEIPGCAPLWGKQYKDPDSCPFAAALFWAVFHLRQLSLALDEEEGQAVNSALDEIIDRFGLPIVPCRLCGIQNPQRLAHLHQGDWIGECCWTESLRASE